MSPSFPFPAGGDFHRRDFLKTSLGLVGSLPMAAKLVAEGVAVGGGTSPADITLPGGAEILRGPGKFTLPLQFSVLAGCYNVWGRNVYWREGAFSIDIETVDSASTCGSPVFTSGSWWVGFLREAGGTVTSDGKRLTFEFPADQEVLVFETQPHDDTPWELYRQLATARLASPPAPVTPAPHTHAWEYCTWVEQKRVMRRGQHARKVLNEGFVKSLAERVLRLGVEPGKFTIDDGWQETPTQQIWTDGYWRPDREAFPDLAKTCAWLASEGFAPGLWFGLGWLPPEAQVLADRPDLFGAWETVSEVEGEVGGGPWSLAPNQATEAYLRETLRPYAEMGFKKFKFDFFYGQRHRTNAVMQALHRAVRSLDPAIEIESHHPDFFFSRWCDVCRLNDVLIQPGRDWEGLTLAHMRLTRLCAPDRIMNLDHLGGNDPEVGERDFLHHIKVLDLAPEDQARYAVLSILPDQYSVETRQKVRRFLERHRRAPFQTSAGIGPA